MKKLENIFLYLVVLGGRAKKANIELHDVRWVVGSKIEDTFNTLRKNWFGSPEGLHIDSYKKIRSIDGYKINLIYYMMSFISSSFGVKGLLPPIFAAWFPVIISVGGGFYFLKKSSSI